MHITTYVEDSWSIWKSLLVSQQDRMSHYIGAVKTWLVNTYSLQLASTSIRKFNLLDVHSFQAKSQSNDAHTAMNTQRRTHKNEQKKTNEKVSIGTSLIGRFCSQTHGFQPDGRRAWWVHLVAWWPNEWRVKSLLCSWQRNEWSTAEECLCTPSGHWLIETCKESRLLRAYRSTIVRNVMLSTIRIPLLFARRWEPF